MMIAAERRWGLGQHGGKRKQPPSGWQQKGDAVAESAVGGDNSADEVRKPDGKRNRLCGIRLCTGGIRLCTGVDLGYRLIGPPLGKGTFGTTYHALWKNGDTDVGGQHVVVKHIPLARPDKSLLRYEAREVEILSMLHHNNVVKLLFAVQTPFALDLLLEVCDADLRKVLRQWGMTEAESKDAIRQICHGLEYIHDLNVVHRDVKPANILMQKVRGQKIYKLSDVWVSSANVALQVCGHWHRKEQVCGHWHRKDAHGIAYHGIVVSSSRNLLAMP